MLMEQGMLQQTFYISHNIIYGILIELTDEIAGYEIIPSSGARKDCYVDRRVSCCCDSF
jgi:hypothetical protein